jgi:hypothetical protein
MSRHTLSHKSSRDPSSAGIPGQRGGQPPGTGWSESYRGGSPEAERAAFATYAATIMAAQALARKKASAHSVPHGPARTLHAKATLALEDAELRFLDTLPADLRHGFAQPGAAYRTTVRFSNAANTGEPDFKKDLRGVALRVRVDERTVHDLLMTNYPVSHARDARQFVEFARATAGGPLSQGGGLVRLLRLFGPRETIRMLQNVFKGRSHKPGSVFTETYWSRGALRWGPDIAVRYLLRPVSNTPASAPSATDSEYLSVDAARRLRAGSVQMELCIQRYRDPVSTPIENTSVRWADAAAPPEPVALLTLPQGDTTNPESQAVAEAVDALAFNPWNTTDEFRPLGNLNRARKAAYDASAAVRGSTRWHTDVPTRNVVAGAAARAVFAKLNRRVPWHRLPVRLAVLNLEGFRYVLRRQNLIDTEPPEAPPEARLAPETPPENARWARTADGRYNDLSAPAMGAVGAAFGRNLKADYRQSFDHPNPVTVSERLLAREQFLPARSLNLLAAAWIQFQVHDWVNHARVPLGVADVKVPMPGGRTWKNTPDGPPENVMRIAGNEALVVDRDGTQRLFSDSASHWWDASEVYGADEAKVASLRDGAKLRLTDGGYLPEDTTGMDVTGFNESWWLGLSGLHTLFAREHNVLCDELRAHYRGWSDERIYQTARLIVAALIAKIHTVEWTPAILGTEAIDLGLKANWNGPPSNDWLTRLGMWLLDTHASVGIPSTTPDHHGVPYSLTEDFVTVYRMHPLIPDDYRFLDHSDGHLVGTSRFDDISGTAADQQLRALGMENVLYSFGRAHPGVITLHNYPDALRDFVRNDEHIDLSVIDLVRTRRRGIPRYNDFREGLHKPRLRDFEELTTNPESLSRLREVYRDVDEVDTMVGLFAETPPEGFGFSDTAFRIFILMASRRLQSDRFLTVDFRPEIYSPFGMDWIANNGMSSVILRNCPDVATLLPRGQTAFSPWRPADAAPAGRPPADTTAGDLPPTTEGAES